MVSDSALACLLSFSTAIAISSALAAGGTPSSAYQSWPAVTAALPYRERGDRAVGGGARLAVVVHDGRGRFHTGLHVGC